MMLLDEEVEKCSGLEQQTRRVEWRISNVNNPTATHHGHRYQNALAEANPILIRQIPR